MQNKGFVKVFAVLLTLVCVFYLSFSFVTRYHMDKAAQDPKGEAHYLDSMQNEKVYLGSYTLKQCREMEIGLGLDLKGGMPGGVVVQARCGWRLSVERDGHGDGLP
jgi:SecD/SecF fusion protein